MKFNTQSVFCYVLVCLGSCDINVFVTLCSAAKDLVTATTSAEHLQRLHSADCSTPVCSPFHIARLSQDSVGTPITTKVTDLLASSRCNRKVQRKH